MVGDKMKRLLIAVVLSVGLGFISGGAIAQTFTTGQTVHAKQDNTIGCLAEDTLREVGRQMANTTPAPGWEDRLAGLHCYPVARDLDWKVAEMHGTVVRAQLAEPGVPSPVMYFSVGDMAIGPGQ
jgi:hypothetical protein